MGAYDEAQTELINALLAWDFSVCFPVAYTGSKKVLITEQDPYDLRENMLAESGNKQMTTPIITVLLADQLDAPRAFGDHSVGINSPGPTLGQQEYATRIHLMMQIECWADQFLGGIDTAVQLAGQVQGCLFYNKTRLAALRHLKTIAAKPSYDDGQEAWCVTVHAEGDAVVSYFA